MSIHPFDEYINELPLPGEKPENLVRNSSFNPARLGCVLWTLMLLSLAVMLGLVQLLVPIG